MVLLYASAAWFGGILTAAVLWPACGAVLAVAAAPFGASALTAGTAMLVYLHRTRRRRARRPAGRAAQARYRWHPAR
ncbi:hypothetical protein [Methylobacterium gregans]|uniref:Uncharacterized protein n=1 Tax=Methylobacterium gregans TaxID=374424 RepID=A0AA37MBE7_9HYPH|nr:hypothetical protein [Methylobacterium gregans]MDQ0523117.1 hypothetical protein [Methylobacterium gregans]GJD79757.1 hypothetical protein NBEOAGPD_2986 [Methylobacterium gregans]GLS56973.1 hypothetical protein GCM10007886_51590 [Methylobacterium gregans]